MCFYVFDVLRGGRRTTSGAEPCSIASGGCAQAAHLGGSGPLDAVIACGRRGVVRRESAARGWEGLIAKRSRRGVRHRPHHGLAEVQVRGRPGARRRRLDRARRARGWRSARCCSATTTAGARGSGVRRQGRHRLLRQGAAGPARAARRKLEVEQSPCTARQAALAWRCTGRDPSWSPRWPSPSGPRRPAAAPALPRAADRQGGEGRRPGGTMTAQTVPGVEISKPDKVLFPRRRDHQARPGDVLRRHRGSDAAAPARPAGQHAAVPRRHRGAGVLREEGARRTSPTGCAPSGARPPTGRSDRSSCEDARTLVYLAQQACITPHTWLCREDDLDRPDQLIFDLDPSDDGPDTLHEGTARDPAGGGAARRRGAEVVPQDHRVARLPRGGPAAPRRGLRRRAGVRPRAWRRTWWRSSPTCSPSSTARTSAGTGSSSTCSRNGYGQTAVPPYAVRPRPGAPVSTPIAWDELSRIEPAQHDIRSVRRRLRTRGCPWAEIRRHPQGLATASKRLG